MTSSAMLMKVVFASGSGSKALPSTVMRTSFTPGNCPAVNMIARTACMPPSSCSDTAANSFVKSIVTTPSLSVTAFTPQFSGRGRSRPLSFFGPLASSSSAVERSAVENTVRVTGTSIRPLAEGK